MLSVSNWAHLCIVYILTPYNIACDHYYAMNVVFIRWLLDVCASMWLIGFFQATGEDYSVEPADSRRPFRALLDVGLLKTTTGNRVFGALKVVSGFNYDLFA